jgi:hypothetical protein
MTEEFLVTTPIMTEHLERCGWEHYPATAYEEEVWLLPGRIQFEGDDSLLRAYYWQVQQEAV